mmetsp:Transcript_17169/g.21680  ORF Transcript_17169/g.21680 Transcript_17169/m.21680 type:complete len:84 (+) Transcript_17169:112-363(+)
MSQSIKMKKPTKYTHFNINGDSSEMGSPMAAYLVDEPPVSFDNIDHFLMNGNSRLDRVTSLPNKDNSKAGRVIKTGRVVDGKR